MCTNCLEKITTNDNSSILVSIRVIVVNNLADLRKIIADCSQNDKVDILISLRAFLADQEDNPWVYFKSFDDLSKIFDYLHSNNIKQFKNVNISNIKKAKVSPVQIYIIPKNKRLSLIELIDAELLDFMSEYVFLMDTIRTNPFENDLIFDFINKNKSFVDKSIHKIYVERNKSHQKLLSLTEIKKPIYDTCSSLSKKNKLRDYWINTWGDSKNYTLENSIIESIVL